MEWLNRLLGKKSTPQVPENVAKLQREADHLYVLRLGGVFNKPTLDNIQAIAGQDMARGVKDFKLLLILSDFRGWRKGDDWGDMEFFSRHEAAITKIAVVGTAQWESDTLAFLGAGRRIGEVQYFAPEQEAAARAWLKRVSGR